jgi:toxin-antitoxin system PIN domain toxin
LSFALDTNILLYASDESSRLHPAALAFVERCLGGDEVFYLGWPSVMGYLRIATHPAIFERPLSPEEARRNVETLWSHPRGRLLSEDEGFWEIYREISADFPVRGNLVPDAHLAALLRLHGIRTLYTRDRDFRKFPFLETRDPFE